jgi:hypothetical protein
MFLDVESKYGGVEEGVVIKYNAEGSQVILKVQQAQHILDKNKYKGNSLEEFDYWKNVNKAVDEIIDDISEVDLQKSLKIVAKKLKDYTLTFSHVKKTNEQILEDIQFTARTILFKTMPGNQGALFVGKIKILTNTHWSIIKDAQAKYDTVTVALISSKETKGTKELRNKVLNACFDSIEIINTSSENLFTIMNKANTNINFILGSPGRTQENTKILAKKRGITAVEVDRTDEAVADIIKNISDINYFKKNTPKCVWPFYEDYVKAYKE